MTLLAGTPVVFGGRATPRTRVLIIDDDEDDYLIARDLLSEIEGELFETDWAGGPEEAWAKINDDSVQYDICLLDYRLGRHNGISLLREAIKTGFSAPIILLTGQEDHEVDREAVRAGASDYLVKGRINAILLERAIRYARQQKQAQDALRDQTDFVSAILDTAGALVVVLDRKGCIARFNRACEQATGWTSDEVFGKPFWDIVLPDDESERVRTAFANLLAGQFPNYYENNWKTKAGGLRVISWANTALLGRNGVVDYIVSTGIDITHQREAEEALVLAREREIEVGSSIQKTLLVRRPPNNLPGLSVGAKSVPSLKIGGDYFDFFVFDDRYVDVLVGDVMGKGVPAALLAAATKNHFQRAVRRLGLSLAPFGRLPQPEEIVSAVHGALTPELAGLNSFVTLAYLRFDLLERMAYFVDCGHPRPLCVPVGSKTCSTLSGENVPLGMSEREIYKQVPVSFDAGDLFFFYSDGLTEACDENEEEFGEARLMEALLQNKHLTPPEIAENIHKAVQDFCQNSAAQPDDLTCVALRVQDWLAPARRAHALMEMSSDANELERARDFVTAFCRDKCLKPGGDCKAVDEDDQDLIALAVNEAAANVIEHAYRGRADALLQIEAEAFDHQVRIRLWDTGEPFVPRDSIPPPIFDGSKDSGFGVFLMEQCFDRVEHSRDDMGRNCLSLVKHFTR